MPHFVSTRDENEYNMDDIASDFVCLKVSALKKASQISGQVDRITIGPNLKVNENENEKTENIENEQNSCNVRVPQKSNRPQNKTSVQSGISFSVKKILLECEYQRKEEVQKEIDRRWQQMKESGKAILENMAISRLNMAKERERKIQENNDTILKEQQKAGQEELRRRHERQRELEEYRKKMREKEEVTTKLIILRNLYDIKYRYFAAYSENCKDKNSVAIALSSHAAKLEELNYQMNLIDEKIRADDVTATDLSIIEKIVNEVDEILCSFKSEIDRINVQYEETLIAAENAMHSALQTHKSQGHEIEGNQVACEPVILEQCTHDVQNNASQSYEENQTEVQDENRTVVLNIPKVVPSNANAEESATSESDKDVFYEYADTESLQIYENSKKFLTDYLLSLDEFLQSADTKKFRFECQKAINIPVNAISGINAEHLRDKYERLQNLLIGKSWPNVKQYPQGEAFCKNILSKKIVSQGETLVSSKPKMAFPIAAVVVALWNEHPDFGHLLLSHFHDLCPFTVPVFIPKMVGQSNEDYYKSMGYKYSEDGTVEKHDKYLKRMSGLMRLYASIIITHQRKRIAKSNPHGLQNAWRWLAAVLNIEPRKEITDLCATLLLDILEVSGNALWTAYPKQFYKLLILLTEEYYPRMQNVGFIGGGPLVRLEEFLRNSLTKGSIPPPEGELAQNFW
ncbi:nucleoporin GLE1 [Ceratina calcarata]|uniref:mRNA export factor GLE1 n=1 Tax=Ceratina calcarata TaxID=156304 RepID=A0AAJ7NBM7_9HYME|nr:nucleoporin GLE1 [Ceratina calcarata]